MNTCLRILGALTLVLLSGHAAAIPTLKKVKPTFFQSSNSTLSAGLIVEAETDLLVLVLAGGFTITCSMSSLQHQVQRTVTFSDSFGPDAILRVPSVVPSSYGIPGWSSIPTGTCGGQCMHAVQGRSERRNQPVDSHWHDRRGRDLRAHPRGAAIVRQLRCSATSADPAGRSAVRRVALFHDGKEGTPHEHSAEHSSVLDLHRRLGTVQPDRHRHG